MNLIQTIDNLIQETSIVKKKWITIRTSDVDKNTLEKLWDMYVNTYKKYGFNASSAEHFKQKYDVLWFINVDDDPLPDAFITYGESRFGNKITSLGSDNKKLSKSLLVKKLISLVKKKGWFIEAGRKVADILLSSNIPIVKDEKIARKIIINTTGIDIEWIGDGKYKRKLRGTSIIIQERLFGNPRI